MTVLRNNTKQDDGTDTVTGVSWFTFNGTVASNIYASGNSWIGFGASSEHLRVNRRDGALYSLYREEGTLYSYYKFLKIRWKGYSAYSQTSTSYAIEYDIILWDTGDISLHMISIPTSSNNGTYSLVASSTYTYTVSTSAPDVTFKKIDSGFEVQNNIIALEKPFDKRYLIRNGSTIYTILNGALSSLGTVSLTSDLFLNSGVKKIPAINLLSNLTSPELLYWHDDASTATKLSIKGTPPLPQIIQYEAAIPSEKSAIKIMEAAASDDALFAISFDGGSNYKYYNKIEWVDFVGIEQAMTKETLKSITPDIWQPIITSNNYQVCCVLPSTTSYISKLAVTYE